MGELPWIFKGSKTHDCCVDHCRDWRETLGGKLPASDHSPMCKNYKLKKYIRVSIESMGSSYIDIPENLEDIKQELDQEDIDSMTIEYIEMTPDQFEKLPEFDGF
jgi:hypothetical protein